MIVFSSVIPHFDGAFYVYKHLICPCLSMDLQIAINWFNNRKNSSFSRDNFLAEVERYPKENEPEALERTTACKVNQAEPNLPGTENSEYTSMEIKEKAMEVVAGREILNPPSSKKVQKEWACAISPVTPLHGKKHKAIYDVLKMTSQAEPKIEDSTFEEMETKLEAVEVETGKKILESFGEVQTDGTRVSSMITTPSETTLDLELDGRKLKEANEALKANNQAYVSQVAPASNAKKSDQPNEVGTRSSGFIQEDIINEKVQGSENTITGSITKNSDESKEEPAESVCKDGMKKNAIVNIKENVQGQEQNPNEVPRMMGSRLWCKICCVQCSGEFNMASHLNGRKHKENVQEQQQNANKVIGKNNPPLRCKICNVGCSSEIDLASHLSGRKHKENVQEKKRKADEVQHKPDPPLWCKVCSVSCSGEFNMASHLNGRKHKENAQEQQPIANKVIGKNGPPLWCKICNVGCSGEISLASHLNGKKHKENVQEQQQNSDKVQHKKDPPLYCKVCSVSCWGEIDMVSHLNGRKHKENA